LFLASGNASDKLTMMKDLLTTSEIGMQGISELEFIVDSISELELRSAKLEIEVTLARGLNYYTGTILEVTPPVGVQMGSIGGGGRYDDLTGIFGLNDVSGIGISFGLDRIYLVLEDLDLFPETVSANTKVLFINFGKTEAMYAMRAIAQLRNRGINAELYPDAVKMSKQMSYCDKREIPFAVLAGSSEIEADTFTLKNMKSGEQETISYEKMIQKLS
jgi:histidyl-tRNA synthetase